MIKRSDCCEEIRFEFQKAGPIPQTLSLNEVAGNVLCGLFSHVHAIIDR